METRMVVVLLAGLGVAGCQTATIREHETIEVSPEARPETPASDSWVGTWKGTCVATRPDGRKSAFAMALDIQPTQAPGQLTWRLVYGTGAERQVRDYTIAPADGDPGHWRIDEGNSIFIDAWWIRPTLYTQYSIEGALLTATYTFQDARLVFELLSANLAAPVPSGGVGDTPSVLCYPLEVVQRAELRRVSTAER